MTRRTVLLALATGLSAFLAVGVAVTEPLGARVWPSLLVGIPAGIAAGLAGAGFVYGGLAPESPRRRPAIAAASFGVAFLAMLLVAAVGLQLRTTVSLALAVGVGAVVALAAYVRSAAVESRVT